MTSKLLHTPDGVRDLYGNDLLLKSETMKKIEKVFSSYGFHDIETPTFEYFDIFSNEIGTTPSRDLYKFFDKEGDTLALRPDFTPGVARCAAKYYMDVNIPVRFRYKGNAFINSSLLQGKLCEGTQMGVEYIGDDSIYADAELISLCTKAVLAAGISDFQVCIGSIEFIRALCEEAGIKDDIKEALRECVSIKNFFGARELLTGKVDDIYLEALLKLGDMGDNDEFLTSFKGMVKSERVIRELDRLSNLYKLLCDMGVSKYVSFDLGMVSKLNYYTGIIFKVFTYGVGDAFVKGGRYDSLLSKFGKDSPAVGFMIALDDLVNALRYTGIKPVPEIETAVFCHENKYIEGIEIADDIRKKGRTAFIVSYNETNKNERLGFLKESGVTIMEI